MNKKISKDDINSLYKNILFREGDESGINNFLKSGDNLDVISKKMKNSPEYKNQIKKVIDAVKADKNKKILLFGAYGNDNLGDAIQQNFVKKALLEADFKGEIWACSHLNKHYNFDEDKKIPARFINSHAFLKNFDLILVGGGGLLAHPHYPLHIEEWGAKLDTPVALLAVGATNFAATSSTNLIKKACHVSGRDDASIKCLEKYTESVDLIPDPVLCMQDYKKIRNSSINRTAWILKGPMNKELEEIRKQVKVDDVVICFQKNVDQEIEGLFPELIYTPTEDSFYKAIKGCTRSFSMRYHGLILSLSCINNVYAMGDPKNYSLMRELGVGNNYYRTVEQIKNINNSKKLKVNYDHDKNRALFVNNLHKILENI